LTSIAIPEGVTSIGDFAFDDCSSLTSIDIPDGVTSIGSAAFAGCSSLKSVHITDFSAWCKIAFSNSSSNPLCYAEKFYLNNQELTELTIPADIKQIKNYAFCGYGNLKKVIINDGVTSIGVGAFYNCSSLTSIAIPEGVTSIGDFAFDDCSSLTSIAIPESVTSIGNYAFASCYSLKSVHITDLSAWCKITFSNSSSNPLNRTGVKLYLNNEELTELTIPADIKLIKNYAFYGYKALTKVTMGEGVTSIGEWAFVSCSSLTQVYCYGITPPTIDASSYSSFDSSKYGKTLYVPKGRLSVYQSSSWADFFGTITEMD
jgi:hypothetical protein